MLVIANRILTISHSVSKSYQFVRTMHLLQNKTLVNGNWISGTANKEFAVINPATGDTITTIPDLDATDAQQAIDAAHKTFHSTEWQNLTAKQRSGLLKKWYNLMEKHRADLAAITTAESGKPIKEALIEISYGNSFVEWFAEEARRIYGNIIPSPDPSKELLVIKQPIGVAGLITPWNFPHAMITRKSAAAIAAGCTVVIKPAEDTPLTCLALAKLADEAGFPKGVINVVTCSRTNAPAIGNLLCKSPQVSTISFTGSTEVGRILYANCSPGIKRISLELGGNAPFIVFKSADIDKAVTGAINTKFRNCGQACIAANRFLLQEDIADEFIKKFTKSVNGLVIGNGKDETTQIGPLVNEAQIIKVTDMVNDAVSKGAKLVTGGKSIPNLGKLFYEPTILVNIQPNMRLFNEEVFGPVASIITFKTEEEALRIANDTQRGLAGYLYTQDLKQVFRASKKLEVGMVGVNEGTISSTELPFGGVKESGIGREGSIYGIDEYIEIKSICLGNMKE